MTFASVTHPWGKLERDKQGRITRWQSLADHSRDVAETFRELVLVPGIGQRLARLAGVDGALAAGTIERLTYLAFLHDCGKVNGGFQARTDPGAPPIGHIAPLATIFGARPDPAVCRDAAAALAIHALAAWGDAVTPLFDAILSHHGRPWPQATADGLRYAKYWRPSEQYSPIEALRALREAADLHYPNAHADHAPLPTKWPFVHAVAGLVQLADWLASSHWSASANETDVNEWPRRVLCQIGLDPGPYRERLPDTLDFRALFDVDPYPHQAACGTGIDPLLVLEADTGSGKTEAALWRFAALFQAGLVDGLYFALPTRTAAVQLHHRIKKFIHRLWPHHAPPVVLAVPGYVTDDGGGALPNAEDPLDTPEGDTRSAPVWAAEHPKRFFAGMIGVGTVDQALLAAIRVKHAHLRGACLMRHFLVVDEVHASDAYMRCLLEQLLRDHLAAGGYAMLLSATLGGAARASLLGAAAGSPPGRTLPTFEEAVRATYPQLSRVDPVPVAMQLSTAQPRRRRIRMRIEPLLDEPAGVAALAAGAAAAGAKVLVVRNTVSGAVAVQRALEAAPDAADLLFQVAGRATLHHGRFAREDRRRLDRAVEHVVGRTRPAGGTVVVGTQTLEQSLDIDADLLITDLCPVDVLLQRLGRLHRHHTDGHGQRRVRPEEFETPRCIVLVPATSLASFLASRRAGGLSRHGLGHTIDATGALRGIYVDLAVLEATRRLLEDHPAWVIPDMNRMLVESALHHDALERLVCGMPDEQRPAWEKHRRDVEGDTLALQLTGASNLLRRDRDFMAQPVDDAVNVASRLGGMDRLLELPRGTMGPFGRPVTRLTAPAWMLTGVPPGAPVTCTEHADTSLLITVGDRAFTYGPHGLHPFTVSS